MTVAWLHDSSEEIECAIAGYLEFEDDLPDEFRGPPSRDEDDPEIEEFP